MHFLILISDLRTQRPQDGDMGPSGFFLIWTLAHQEQHCPCHRLGPGWGLGGFPEPLPPPPKAVEEGDSEAVQGPGGAPAACRRLPAAY